MRQRMQQSAIGVLSGTQTTLNEQTLADGQLECACHCWLLVMFVYELQKLYLVYELQKLYLVYELQKLYLVYELREIYITKGNLYH